MEIFRHLRVVNDSALDLQNGDAILRRWYIEVYSEI